MYLFCRLRRFVSSSALSDSANSRVDRLPTDLCVKKERHGSAETYMIAILRVSDEPSEKIVPSVYACAGVRLVFSSVRRVTRRDRRNWNSERSAILGCGKLRILWWIARGDTATPTLCPWAIAGVNFSSFWPVRKRSQHATRSRRRVEDPRRRWWAQKKIVLFSFFTRSSDKHYSLLTFRRESFIQIYSYTLQTIRVK